jgi:hypothetical protein
MGAFIAKALTQVTIFSITGMYWLVGIMLLLGLPTFISGVLVGIFGVFGHLIFIGIVVFALIYYFKNINKLVRRYNASRNIQV